MEIATHSQSGQEIDYLPAFFIKEPPMFYRLKSGCALRGWEEMSWVLLKRPENSVRPIAQDQFQVLLLCDGQTDLPGNLLDESLTRTLHQCVADGLAGFPRLSGLRRSLGRGAAVEPLPPEAAGVCS